MEGLFLNNKPERTKHKCHKSCNDLSKKGHLYDQSKLQKLKEIFNFDYLLNNCNASDSAKCCYENKEGAQTQETQTNEIRHYTYTWNNENSKDDAYLYVPLEAISSSTYPLSLPPPRSDADIVPVSSSIASSLRNTLPSSINARPNKGETDIHSLNAEKQLLLHDLLSGDIYDN